MSARSTCEICRVKDFDRSVRRSLTLAVFGRGLAASAGCTYKGAVDRRAFLGIYSAHNWFGVRSITFFWHFVDVVWLVMFVTIFLM